MREREKPDSASTIGTCSYCAAAVLTDQLSMMMHFEKEVSNVPNKCEKATGISDPGVEVQPYTYRHCECCETRLGDGYPRFASSAVQQGLAEVCSSIQKDGSAAALDISALHNTLLVRPTLRVRVVDKVSSSHWVDP
jgi:hypothetical protein